MVAGLRPPSGQPMAGCLGFASAPSATALKLTSPSGVVGWLVRNGVDPLLISPSLPSPRRLPFASWLQMVVSSFSCSGIPTGDFNPIYNVPMLGTHKALMASRQNPIKYPTITTQPRGCHSSTLAKNESLDPITERHYFLRRVNVL